MEGCYGVLVDGDVVGVTVAAVGLERDDYIRADAADGAHQGLHNFSGGSVDEGAPVVILGRANHARVAVIQED